MGTLFKLIQNAFLTYLSLSNVQLHFNGVPRRGAVHHERAWQSPNPSVPCALPPNL